MELHEFFLTPLVAPLAGLSVRGSNFGALAATAGHSRFAI
jgi:hypothetical protein